MSKMFIGNLPFKMVDSELKSLFEEVGEVTSAVIIKDKQTGRSRGFGFVEMSDNDVKTAMSTLNEREVDGRNIKISDAREKEDRRPPNDRKFGR